MAALANIRHGIADPGLRAKVTPSYELGCKRVCISNTYYPALACEHVDLVTSPIVRVTAGGVVTADGVEHEIDVLVLATGFHATDQPIAARITGRDGRTLAETWSASGMAAYKGTTVHGFPNLFQVVGPNTVLGHSSMVHVIESQVAYLVGAVRALREGGFAALEPRKADQDRWNADLQRRMRRTVWNTGGCASWYLDEHGRNTTLWPRSTWVLRRLLAQFDLAAYVVTVRQPRPSRRRRGPHEDPGRQGRRHHRRRVRHRPGPRARAAGRGALLALSDVDEAGLAETVTLAQAGRRPRGPRRPPRRRRPRRDAAYADAVAEPLRPGQRDHQQRRGRPGRRLHRPRPGTTWSGSWASTSGAWCTAPRSSCRT